MKTANRAHLNTGIFKAGFVAFALMCALLLLPGCSSDSGWLETEEETATTEVAETEPVTEATTEADVTGMTIELTDNYSYSLPEDAEELTDFDESEGFAGERRFLIDDGETIVRSFIITGEVNAFPGLVEFLYEDNENAEIGYREFFSTAIATADDTVSDVNGETVYRRTYFWPDGAATLCSLSIEAYSEDAARDTGKKVLRTVRNNGDADSRDTIVPSNAEEAVHPSQEEIDQAIMEEAKEAMMDSYEEQEQYYDYDTSLGKRR